MLILLNFFFHTKIFKVLNYDEILLFSDDKQTEINTSIYIFHLTDEIIEISEDVTNIVIGSLENHHYF